MHSRIVSRFLRQTPFRRLLQALSFACLTASTLSAARAQTVYTWRGGVMAQINGSFTNNGTYAVISNGAVLRLGMHRVRRNAGRDV